MIIIIITYRVCSFYQILRFNIPTNKYLIINLHYYFIIKN